MTETTLRPAKDKVSFKHPPKEDFYSKVKQEVEKYFFTKHLKTTATPEMYIKTVVLLSLYVLAYAGIVSNLFSGLSLIGIYTFLGMITSLMGFNINHDIMHGAYFSNPNLNRILSYFFDLNGYSSFVWKTTHNLQHHVYTNIPGHDGDIDKAAILRLSPRDPLLFFHRYQHIYAYFLYAFTTLNWIFYGDFTCFNQQRKIRHIPQKEYFLFFVFKILYLPLFLFLPMLLISAPWWQVLLGFFCMHFTVGFMSGVVFQQAHVTEGVEFPFTDSHGKIQMSWVEHELRTTSNFANSSRFWGIMLGGLNFQIEHHLFPYICHVHYPQIAKIVRKWAKVYNLPYHSHATFSKALKSHTETLRKFGRGEM